MKRKRIESAAYTAVIRKCARFVDSIEEPDAETLLLRPQLEWVLRGMDNEALEAAQQPESLRSRLAPFLIREFLEDPKRTEILHNVAVERVWPEKEGSAPFLLLSVATNKGLSTKEGPYTTSKLPRSSQSLNEAWTDLVASNIALDSATELLFKLYAWSERARKLSVYSSNEELLRVFQ